MALMGYQDENDYIMRIIKEMVRVLVSLMLGKKYAQVELPLENKYEISGSDLARWKELIDGGKINEGENLLLENIDYQKKEDFAEALFFYEYAGAKGSDFLKKHNYSEEEILEGLQNIAEKSGYKGIAEMFLQ